ncbi:kinase-like domain-containing protein [Glomus cerebriforme]|uniref:Kinase-like domain-containing protein n=1 Tax=Glomus cerebriforme TaxID=658196 RepID=A0A397TRP4_9GLOM|nr:kinase-like domain-containing protein [Glomus cerebriforme]
MSLNNEIQIESEFNKLRVSDNSVIINHKNCYPWCKECVPRHIIEGLTSENHDIYEFIKDTIYNAKIDSFYPLFLEWVPAEYYRQDDESWKKGEPEPITVVLKRLNGSQNMSADYLNELKTHWSLLNSYTSIEFYGMTKDPETKEFMMVMKFANKGSLRYVLSSNFNNILWKDKIFYLYSLVFDLKNLHRLGYFHKDFHSGNILQTVFQNDVVSYISDFGLSGPTNEQKSDDKICGVLPYIAPEGTPEIYKELAHKCMNANPNQRPAANELNDILFFLYVSTNNWEEYQENEEFGYKGKEIKAIFEEADKEIPNISISYEKVSDAVYTSRTFTFKNLSKPINSSIITSLYLNDADLNELDFKDAGFEHESDLVRAVDLYGCLEDHTEQQYLYFGQRQ